MIIGICCIDNKGSIGKDGGMLFHLPQDLKHFKRITENHILVCGRKTLDSLPNGEPLPNRSTICLCSSQNNREDCFCINDFEECLKLVLELAKTQQVFIIGGGQIFELFGDFMSGLILTEVEANGNGTIFFPTHILDNFKLERKSGIIEENNLKYTFNYYKRKELSE